jgi:4-hydroxybenzoyl-CoA reductase subunit alpha
VTIMMGNAALQAAARVREQLAAAVAEHLESVPDRIVFSQDRVYATENPRNEMSFVEAVALAEARFGTIAAVGSYAPPKAPGRYKGAGVGPSPAYSFSAWTSTPAGCTCRRSGSRTTSGGRSTRCSRADR